MFDFFKKGERIYVHNHKNFKTILHLKLHKIFNLNT